MKQFHDIVWYLVGMCLAFTFCTAAPVWSVTGRTNLNGVSSTGNLDASPMLNNLKNASDESAADSIILRRVLLSAFLPGGLGDVLGQQQRNDLPRQQQQDSLTSGINEIKQELKNIRTMIREQQEDASYRDFQARVVQEQRDRGRFDVFDVLEFFIVMCVFVLLLRIIGWMCTLSKAKEEKKRAGKAADEEGALLAEPIIPTTTPPVYPGMEHSTAKVAV
ncbi:hypothetical protein BV898_00354 [Hypsibius exemplaris]|uniref:GOLD domain-containing protein n=1 Tax=Hypsibius exemplaris TaxID=2072580 RepID=A0A1W0XFH8_HYPEX|nr:hypothetical protein BV898_00354 [Hypsibius exemplaris]